MTRDWIGRECMSESVERIGLEEENEGFGGEGEGGYLVVEIGEAEMGFGFFGGVGAWAGEYVARLAAGHVWQGRPRCRRVSMVLPVGIPLRSI